MSENQKQFWTSISIVPSKWEEREFGEDGNGFWVVGIYEDRIVWYNDIEEGFNISDFSQPGIINEYGAEQDELQTAIEKIRNAP